MSGKKAKQKRRERLASVMSGEGPDYENAIDEMTVNIHERHMERARLWTVRQQRRSNLNLAAIAVMCGIPGVMRR